MKLPLKPVYVRQCKTNSSVIVPLRPDARAILIDKYQMKMPQVSYQKFNAKQSLLAWYEEAEQAAWNSPNELKRQYRNASIINDKRVVFNIHSNDFRLIVSIEYRLNIVFVIWFGTHAQ